MKMTSQPELKKLDPLFLTRLEIEFGDKGKRASDFLKTAQCLLEENNPKLLRIGELVAYSLREVMNSLPDASKLYKSRQSKDKHLDKHLKKLQSITLALTGHRLSGKTPALENYTKVCETLNYQLHNKATLQEAKEMWSKCLCVLESLFMHPTKRNPKLESLAKIKIPTENDTN